MSDVDAEREPESIFLPRDIFREPVLKPSIAIETRRLIAATCYRPGRT